MLPRRLEQHFYKTVVQDLQIITYNHAKALASPPSVPVAQERVFGIFSTPIANLPTRPLEEPTSHLSSLYTKPAKKPWDRPVKSILFGKQKESQVAQAVVPVVEAELLAMHKIKLKVYTEAAITNKQVLLSAIMSLTQITGVRAYPLFAERGDSQKRLREGMCIGCEVELTGSQMYDFLDKLIHTVLPRIREWQGMNPVRPDSVNGLVLDLDKSTMGFFSDIEPFFDMYPGLFDTQITFYTTGLNEYDDALVLSSLGFPLLKTPIVPEKIDENVTVSDPNDPYAMYKKVEKKKQVPIVGTPIRKKMK